MILSPINRSCLDLANAIVAQAAEDYRDALNGKSYNYKSPKIIAKECEKFFRSKWYRMLTKVDGEYLIDALRKEHEERNEKLCESN